MKKVKIKGKNYNIKYTIRALFIWEQITGKSFKIENMLDNYIFFYAMLLANNKDDVIQWDDFIEAIDDDPNLFEKMATLVAEQQKKDEMFETQDEKGEKKS